VRDTGDIASHHSDDGDDWGRFLCRSDREIPADRGLTFLINDFDLALDQLLPVLFTFARHLTSAGESVAGPHLACEADLETAHGSSPGEVSQASRQASCGPHTLREDGGNSGRFDEGLIVMQRDEIARRACIAYEIRTRDVLDGHSRE
jgi:hypothetical protein